MVMWGRGWQVPGLLLRLFASRSGLQDGGPVYRDVCHLRLTCLSSLCPPGWREMVWGFSPSVGIWGRVSDPKRLCCYGLEWVTLMGNRSGILATPICWPLGAPSWSLPPVTSPVRRVAKDTEGSGFCVGSFQGSNFQMPDTSPPPGLSVRRQREGLPRWAFPGSGTRT